jgi:hypothetical protein
MGFAESTGKTGMAGVIWRQIDIKFVRGSGLAVAVQLYLSSLRLQ